MRLPHNLRNEFYKSTRDFNLLEGNVNLIFLERWLESRIKTYFNPLANIIANQEKKGNNTRTNLKEDLLKNVNTINQGPSSSNDSDTLSPGNSNKEVKCFLCSHNHRLMDCQKFQKQGVSERKTFVKKEKLCFNCLSKAHSSKDCPSHFRCRVTDCKQKHHTLLHQDKPNSVPNNATVNKPENDSESQPNTQNSTVNLNCNSVSKPLFHNFGPFLQVLPLFVSNQYGKRVKVNALLDSGSDSTLISKDLADELNLTGKEYSLRFSNALNLNDKFKSKLVNFSLFSKKHPEEVNVNNAWVVENLNLPKYQINKKNLQNDFSYLKDIDFDIPINKEISVLIGADLPELHISNEVRRGGHNQPIAISTKLGWVLMGGKSSYQAKINSNFLNIDSCTLENFVEQFWQIESYGTVNKNDPSLLPRNEKKALQILESTVEKVDNHYSVGLLWKENPSLLPNNRNLALSRLTSLEKKFKNNPEFGEKYKATINDYISKGHASKIPLDETENDTFVKNYIPHHGVTNVNKPNKVRVVFDAGAKYKSTSLNQYLLKGPDYLNNLIGILIRFRVGKYAVIGDIEAMFHQIFVQKKDRDALRFLWRNDSSEPVEDYRMNVHLFGKVDSPCIANWTLKRTATDQLEFYDQSSIDAICDDFYMDDYLKSFQTSNEAIKTCHDIIEILLKGGFHLTKFVSNSRQILNALPPEDVSPKLTSIDLDLDDIPIERALGILWNPESDTLQIKYTPKPTPITKRGILTVVSSIFDPLGITAPSIIEPKLIIQELWKRNIEWDETVPTDLETRWLKWLETLPQIQNISLPRWYGFVNNKIELHIFADASKVAYGVVAYVRFFQDTDAKCSFIMSKSRLAPAKEKSISIPRLELQAAVIASRMKVTFVQKETGYICQRYTLMDRLKNGIKLPLQ